MGHEPTFKMNLTFSTVTSRVSLVVPLWLTSDQWQTQAWQVARVIHMEVTRGSKATMTYFQADLLDMIM